MQKKMKQVISAVLVGTLLTFGTVANTQAFNLGRVLGGVLKVGGTAMR